MTDADPGPVAQDAVRRNSWEIITGQKLGVKKCLCLFLYYGVAIHLPGLPMIGGRFGGAFRTLLAKGIFKKAGRHIRVERGVNFGSGASLEIGDYSVLNIDSLIGNDTVIGRDVMMGPRITILSSGHNFTDTEQPMRLQGALPRQPVIIGNDVWIGTQAIILPGVTIGDHSIVGAGSVVAQDVPESCIVSGNPAKIIASRRKQQEQDARAGSDAP